MVWIVEIGFVACLVRLVLFLKFFVLNVAFWVFGVVRFFRGSPLGCSRDWEVLKWQ